MDENNSKVVENEAVKNKLSLGKEYYFFNLYKHGNEPQWTMHRTHKEAVLDAEATVNTKGYDALHKSIPVHRDFIKYSVYK